MTRLVLKGDDDPCPGVMSSSPPVFKLVHSPRTVVGIAERLPFPGPKQNLKPVPDPVLTSSEPVVACASLAAPELLTSSSPLKVPVSESEPVAAPSGAVPNFKPVIAPESMPTPKSFLDPKPTTTPESVPAVTKSMSTSESAPTLGHLPTPPLPTPYLTSSSSSFSLPDLNEVLTLTQGAAPLQLNYNQEGRHGADARRPCTWDAIEAVQRALDQIPVINESIYSVDNEINALQRERDQLVGNFKAYQVVRHAIKDAIEINGPSLSFLRRESSSFSSSPAPASLTSDINVMLPPKKMQKSSSLNSHSTLTLNAMEKGQPYTVLQVYRRGMEEQSKIAYIPRENLSYDILDKGPNKAPVRGESNHEVHQAQPNQKLENAGNVVFHSSSSSWYESKNNVQVSISSAQHLPPPPLHSHQLGGPLSKDSQIDPRPPVLPFYSGQIRPPVSRSIGNQLEHAPPTTLNEAQGFVSSSSPEQEVSSVTTDQAFGEISKGTPLHKEAALNLVNIRNDVVVGSQVNSNGVSCSHELQPASVSASQELMQRTCKGNEQVVDSLAVHSHDGLLEYVDYERNSTNVVKNGCVYEPNSSISLDFNRSNASDCNVSSQPDFNAAPQPLNFNMKTQNGFCDEHQTTSNLDTSSSSKNYHGSSEQGSAPREHYPALPPFVIDEEINAQRQTSNIPSSKNDYEGTAPPFVVAEEEQIDNQDTLALRKHRKVGGYYDYPTPHYADEEIGRHQSQSGIPPHAWSVMDESNGYNDNDNYEGEEEKGEGRGEKERQQGANREWPFWKQSISIRENFDKGFQAPHRLISKRYGESLSDIRKRTGAEWIRVKHGVEAPSPGITEIEIHCRSREGLEEAVRAIMERVRIVLKEWENYYDNHRHSPSAMSTLINGSEDGDNSQDIVGNGHTEEVGFEYDGDGQRLNGPRRHRSHSRNGSTSPFNGIPLLGQGSGQVRNLGRFRRRSRSPHHDVREREAMESSGVLQAPQRYRERDSAREWDRDDYRSGREWNSKNFDRDDMLVQAPARSSSTELGRDRSMQSKRVRWHSEFNSNRGS